MNTSIVSFEPKRQDTHVELDLFMSLFIIKPKVDLEIGDWCASPYRSLVEYRRFITSSSKAVFCAVISISGQRSDPTNSTKHYLSQHMVLSSTTSINMTQETLLAFETAKTFFLYLQQNIFGNFLPWQHRNPSTSTFIINQHERLDAYGAIWD